MRTALVETAQLLAEARKNVRRVTIDQAQKPVDFAEAYAVQDAIGRDLAPGAAPGWKVGAPDAKTVPTAAPIYAVMPCPARIAAKGLHMIGVEAEIAYVFGNDLPARGALYSTDEVLRALSVLCVAIEVCD